MRKVVVSLCIVSVILVVFISGCVQQSDAESIVSANEAKIKVDLQASGLEMNTNKLSTTYLNETSWKVEIYKECQTEPCPMTYCTVYASVNKNTNNIEKLEFAFGCQDLNTENKCSNFECTGNFAK